MSPKFEPTGLPAVLHGRRLARSDRRSLTQLDQYDIPLLTADGTLHVVELKGPCIAALVLL